MPTRQFLWLAPRLTCPSASPPALAPNAALRHQRRPIHDPPIRPRPAVGQRRWLAFHSHDPSINFLSEPLSTPNLDFVSRFPDSNFFEEEAETSKDRATAQKRLIRAIQFRDVPRIVPLFLEWTNHIREELEAVEQDTLDKPHKISLVTKALDELHELPVTTFSEILRWIDPITNPSNDVAYGMNISKGQAQFIDSAKWIDVFGIRNQHYEVLQAVKTLMKARRISGIPIMTGDFTIAMRCAGAASDSGAALAFFGDMPDAGLLHKRNTSVWTELTKAYFLTEPLYYQFDRARVAISARRSYNKRAKLSPPMIWKMERLRLSIQAILRQPFQSRRDRITQDLRMKLRHKSKTRSHWYRSRLRGVLVDEDFLSTTLIMHARSSSLTQIRGDIINRGLGLNWKEDFESGEFHVDGGRNFRPGNPREPTERMLHAIVEAFGSMGRIRVALSILIYGSRKWDIPISHKIWSSMLSWTYVAASKPIQSMRRLEGRYPVHMLEAKDVIAVWKTMISEPFNIKPSFEDYNIYVKSLIITRNHRAAIDVIRNEVVPYYNAIKDEHYNVAEDEILQDKTEPSYQRIQIEMRKEYMWYHISAWFTDILKTASKSKLHRNGAFMRAIIPDLVAEFGEFFQPSVTYRSTQGRVTLHRSHIPRRYDYVEESRRTIPTPVGGMVLTSLRKKGMIPWSSKDPEFIWPEYPQMTVRQPGRKPRERRRVKGIAPDSNSVTAPTWWKVLEQELSK